MYKMFRRQLVHYSIWGLISLLFVASCKDVFETDLENKQVSILAPSDSLVTTVATQTFWWEEVEGALEYNIQIVTPSFSAVQYLVLDSFTLDNTYTLTLTPGAYQWRVKALNGSSETEYTTYTLVVDTTSDLTSQIVVLQTPSDDVYLNTTSQTFTWNSLYSATEYKIQLASPDFSSTSNISLDTNIENNSLTYSVSEEGAYEWRVMAINTTSQSPFSSARWFYIDLTSPVAPTLLLPSANDTVSNPFTLYWDHSADSGSPLTDTLYLYRDSLIDQEYKMAKLSTNHSDSLGIGDYYWRVRSVDKAGNIGVYSELRKFIVE